MDSQCKVAECQDEATGAVGVVFLWLDVAQTRTRIHTAACCSVHHEAVKADMVNQLRAELEERGVECRVYDKTETFNGPTAFLDASAWAFEEEHKLVEELGVHDGSAN